MRSKIGAILLALASGNSCGASAKYPTTARGIEVRPRADVQATLDACAAKNDSVCIELCQQVFRPTRLQEVTGCSHELADGSVRIYTQVTTHPDPAGDDTSEGSSDADRQGCAPGRRPLGLACPASPAPSALAAFFARSAQLEAASVTAFARIHRFIARPAAARSRGPGYPEIWAGRGTPHALLARVRSAVADELAHARIMIALARTHGADPRPPVIAPEPPLALVDRAIENVVEGCVGEAVAALHAAFIASAAPDPNVRHAFAQLVDDEGRHALLAYELASYFERELSATERVRVNAAFHVARLRVLAERPTPTMVALGIPDDERLPIAIASLLDQAALELPLRVAVA